MLCIIINVPLSLLIKFNRVALELVVPLVMLANEEKL